MKKVILDTNFILTCIRQKIDFFKEITELGIEITIPKQVINELKRILESRKKLKFREEAELALIILEKNKFKKIDLKNNCVDKGIIKYSKKYPGLIVATLDKEIQKKVQNVKLIIRGKEKLELQ